jgi:hypothetical protein
MLTDTPKFENFEYEFASVGVIIWINMNKFLFALNLYMYTILLLLAAITNVLLYILIDEPNPYITGTYVSTVGDIVCINLYFWGGTRVFDSFTEEFVVVSLLIL